MENNQFFFVVVYPNEIVKHGNEGVIFESNKTVMLRTNRVDTLHALKTIMFSNIGGIGTKEVGRIAYKFLHALPNGGFTNRLFWIDGDQHMRVMFDIHARLMPQHVMELYAAVCDVVVGAGPSPLSLEIVLLEATLIHYAQPHYSADEYDSEGDSTYVAGSRSSSDTASTDEYVPETSTGGVGRFLMPPPLAIPRFSEVPSHYHILNLDVIQPNNLLNFGEGEDYNTDGGVKFQVGHRLRNRDAVLMAVKNYRQNAEYRFLESDRLKYHCRCKQFTNGCPRNLRVALHQNLNY
ncbi:uncharacterized protein LOC130945990 [Arachis stenosperma]|uniref:uncharacterized protein LOC130945990 n=1 Tax=Arachis stenosperma TaxID=217475 RepID=UPI0025AB6ECD|nr:uncharacterized protein LOC130945990 [Arachis stenosperma]